MRGLLAAPGDPKVAGQESISNAKAEIIYRILDVSPGVYQPANHKSVGGIRYVEVADLGRRASN